MKIRKFVLIALPIMLMSVWISPIKAQMTKQEAQQHTTNKLLRALSEASKKPAGETKDQRRQRLNNLTKEMQIEDAAISQQQIDYNQANMERLLGESANQGYSGGGTAPSSNSGGGTAPSSDYEQRRAARLNGGNPTTSTTNPNAKPAGFGAGYAGGYKETPPVATAYDQKLSGITTNESRKSRSLDDITAGDLVIIMKDEPAKPTKPAKPTEYCKCKGDDWVDLAGIMCFERVQGNEEAKGYQYQSGYYPMTSKCYISVTSFQGPTQE